MTCPSSQGFFVSIIYCYCNGEVQTEIKKMWTRWNQTFEWKGSASCGGCRHGYGSVLTNLSHSSSSQSQLAVASSRTTALFSSRVYRSRGGRVAGSHAALPGYVLSNSDADSLPASIPEEREEQDDGAKRVDDISLKEAPVVLDSGARNDGEEAL
ncbi:parathyroid hormone 2 receptor [Arapaima gigas]